MTHLQVKRFTALSCEPLKGSSWERRAPESIVCNGNVFPSLPTVTAQRFTFNKNGRLTRIWVGYVADRTEEAFVRALTELNVSPCTPSRQLRETGFSPALTCIAPPDKTINIRWESDGCSLRCRNVRKWQHWVAVVSSEKSDYRSAEGEIRTAARKRLHQEAVNAKQRKLQEKARAFSS